MSFMLFNLLALGILILSFILTISTVNISKVHFDVHEQIDYGGVPETFRHFAIIVVIVLLSTVTFDTVIMFKVKSYISDVSEVSSMYSKEDAENYMQKYDGDTNIDYQVVDYKSIGATVRASINVQVCGVNVHRDIIVHTK